MHTFLIIVPDGGMLFEAAGIADILMQANRLMSKDARTPAYQVTLASLSGYPGHDATAPCRSRRVRAEPAG